MKEKNRSRILKRILFVVIGIVFIATFVMFCLAQCGGTLKTVPTIDPRFKGTPEESAEQEKLDGFIRAANEWAEETPSEMWELTSFDGLKLKAKFFRNGNSHSYVVFVHGYHDSYVRFYNYTHPVFEMGYNVLMLSLRAHEPSEGRFITMGYYESEDLKDWLYKLSEYDSEAEIAVIGVSMGATTTLMASGLDLPENVKCMVADSGFSAVRDEYKNEFKYRYHIPAFPTVNLISLYSRIFAGWNINKNNVKFRLPYAKIPIMFIHGGKDTTVPFGCLDVNISLYGGPEYERLVFEDSEHVKAHMTHHEEYFEKVGNFLRKHIH